MARRATEQASQRPNSSLRVRWVEVEVNGADTTIEEALRAVERLRRPAIDAAPIPKRNGMNGAPAAGDKPPSDEPTLFDYQDNTGGVDATSEMLTNPEGDVTAAGNLARKKRGEGEKKDRNVGIKPMGDIDFVPDGTQSLKDLFAEKAPSSDMDQVLVLCYFLQHTIKIAQIGPGHILSGFKHVGKPVPKDLKQTIRNVKEKKVWLNFSDIENIRLTTEGENRVEHELGKNGGAGAK